MADQHDIITLCRELQITQKQLGIICFRLMQSMAPTSSFEFDGDGKYTWFRVFAALPRESQEGLVADYRAYAAEKRTAESRRFLEMKTGHWRRR